MRVVLALIALAVCFATAARAEVVTLRSGEVLKGRIVSRTGDRIVIEGPASRWEVETSRIASIEERDPLLTEWRARTRSVSDTDADGFYAVSQWCGEKGLFDIRETVLQWVIGLDPDHEKARADLGFYRTADGNWVKGAPGGSTSESLFREAVKSFRKKDDAKATKILQDILQKTPNDSDANFLLGELYYLGGKNGHARQQFETLLKSDPAFPWAPYGMAVLSLADSKFDEAEGWAKKALALAASATPAVYRRAMEAEFYFVLGMGQKGRGDSGKPEAEKSFRECLTRDRRHFRAWTEVGVLEGEHGKFKDAMESFSKALGIESKYVPARFNWGVALYQQGDLEGALAKLTPLVRATPPHLESLKVVARCYHRFGKSVQALQYYTMYQQKGGKDPRVADWILEVKK